MTKTSRSSVIGTRVSTDIRTRFAALAMRLQLTEAGLLAKLVDEVLRRDAPSACASTSSKTTVAPRNDRAAEDRVTLRLRAGDRALASERAEARGMKSSSYLVMLIHNHVHGPVVLPPDELAQIKASCAQLAALGRQLRMFGMPNTADPPAIQDIREALSLVRREVEQARKTAAAIVQRNLVSWESRTRGVEHV